MDLLPGYSYYLKVERAMSPNTVASYVSDVGSFLEWLSDDGGRVVGEVRPEDVESFFSEGKRLSKRSQARRLSALKSFFDWLVMEGETDKNPCDRVDAPKLGRYLPDVLSVDEVSAIIDSVDTTKWNGMRDRAILEVLYGCGLRVSEAAGLQLSDIFFKEGFVRIVGKGNKQRLVPMGEMASDALLRYLDVRPAPDGSAAAECVFLNLYGRPLSRVSIFNMVKKQVILAGITKEISPHTFRHSFATHMIENGAPLREVQEMLGHESILTTEIYTHIDSSTWQEAVIEHHPLNRG